MALMGIRADLYQASVATRDVYESEHTRSQLIESLDDFDAIDVFDECWS